MNNPFAEAEARVGIYQGSKGKKVRNTDLISAPMRRNAIVSQRPTTMLSVERVFDKDSGLWVIKWREGQTVTKEPCKNQRNFKSHVYGFVRVRY